jgi:hypothetical protein
LISDLDCFWTDGQFGVHPQQLSAIQEALRESRAQKKRDVLGFLMIFSDGFLKNPR